ESCRGHQRPLFIRTNEAMRFQVWPNRAEQNIRRLNDSAGPTWRRTKCGFGHRAPFDESQLYGAKIDVSKPSVLRRVASQSLWISVGKLAKCATDSFGLTHTLIPPDNSAA